MAEQELTIVEGPMWPEADIQAALSSDAPFVDKAFPRSWDGRLAYAVSMVGSPPVMGITTMAISASIIATLQAWLWAGVYAVLSVLLPMVYVVLMLRRGRVSDIDLQLREQRIKPLIVSIGCSSATCLALTFGAAPFPMVVLVASMWLQMVVIFLITLRWKISMHGAAAAATGAVAWAMIGTPLPLLFGLPLIAWSRVRLRRHTLAQTIAGALLGLAIFAFAILWINHERGR